MVQIEESESLGKIPKTASRLALHVPARRGPASQVQAARGTQPRINASVAAAEVVFAVAKGEPKVLLYPPQTNTNFWALVHAPFQSTLLRTHWTFVAAVLGTLGAHVTLRVWGDARGKRGSVSIKTLSVSGSQFGSFSRSRQIDFGHVRDIFAACSSVRHPVPGALVQPLSCKSQQREGG